MSAAEKPARVGVSAILWASVFLIPLGLISFVTGILIVIFAGGTGFAAPPAVSPAEQLTRTVEGIVLIVLSAAILGAAVYFFIRRSRARQLETHSSSGWSVGLLLAVVLYAFVYVLFQS